MSEVSLIKKNILFAAILVILLGAFTVSTLLESPSPQMMANRNPAARGPASEQALAPIVASSSELNITCSQNTRETFKGYGNQLRITGENCRNGKREILRTTSVLNQTNGVNATVFATSATQFTTDYMSLNAGENQILIVQEGPDGKRMERVFLIAH